MKLEGRGYLDKNFIRSEIEPVMNKLSYADWLIVYYLAKSMDKANFGELMLKLNEELPLFSNEDDEEEDMTTLSRRETARSSARLIQDTEDLEMRNRRVNERTQ